MDTALFYAVNHGMQNAFFDFFMPFISRYKNWLPLLLGLYGYLVYRDRKKGALFFAATLLAVTVSDFISSSILKNLFALPRPCITLPDVHLLTGCSNSGSLPSSHAANSAAIATMLGLYDRRYFWWSVPGALLVSLSRLYLGVHYPSDVLAGALVGIATGWLAMRLAGLSTAKEEGRADAPSAASPDNEKA